MLAMHEGGLTPLQPDRRVVQRVIGFEILRKAEQHIDLAARRRDLAQSGVDIALKAAMKEQILGRIAA